MAVNIPLFLIALKPVRISFSAAAAGEGILIDNVIPQHLESLIAKLREMGVGIEVKDDQMYVRPAEKMKPVDIKTLFIRVFLLIYSNHLLLY